MTIFFNILLFVLLNMVYVLFGHLAQLFNISWKSYQQYF